MSACKSVKAKWDSVWKSNSSAALDPASGDKSKEEERKTPAATPRHRTPAPPTDSSRLHGESDSEEGRRCFARSISAAGPNPIHGSLLYLVLITTPPRASQHSASAWQSPDLPPRKVTTWPPYVLSEKQ